MVNRMRLLFLSLLLSSSFVVGQDGNTDYLTFKDSWQYFIEGDFHQATRAVDEVLTRGVTDPDLRANFFYLKAQLLSMDNSGESLEQAIRYMSDARDLYEERGLSSSEAELGLAKLKMNAGDFDEATVLLDGLPAEYREKNEAYYWHLKARLFFNDRDYPAALEAGKKCYALYKGQDPARAAQALSQVGLYLMLNGDYERGFQATLEAQQGITRSGDTNNYYYSLINMILYNRGKGTGHPEHSISVVKARLQREYDSDLDMLLSFAVNY